jgi:hypothetical protein
MRSRTLSSVVFVLVVSVTSQTTSETPGEEYNDDDNDYNAEPLTDDCASYKNCSSCFKSSFGCIYKVIDGRPFCVNDTAGKELLSARDDRN